MLEFLPRERHHEANILVRRIGRCAGRAVRPPLLPAERGTSPVSNYYLRCSEDVIRIMDRLRDIPIIVARLTTTGNYPSITKALLVAAVRGEGAMFEP